MRNTYTCPGNQGQPLWRVSAPENDLAATALIAELEAAFGGQDAPRATYQSVSTWYFARGLHILLLTPLFIGLSSRGFWGQIGNPRFRGAGRFWNRTAGLGPAPLWASIIYNLWVRPLRARDQATTGMYR